MFLLPEVSHSMQTHVRNLHSLSIRLVLEESSTFSLTESSYMTLDIAVLHSDEVTEVLDDSNLEQSTMEEMDTSNETPDPLAKQTNAHQLLLAQ